MISKDAYTRIFLQQWGKSCDDANMSLFAHKWWQSNRSSKPNALRLTEEGFEFLTNELDVKMYDIPFTEPIELSPQTIIFLERYIDCPYFLTNQSIAVFSERKSFELYLFSDDIRKFGLVKAMNERQKDLGNLDKTD